MSDGSPPQGPPGQPNPAPFSGAAVPEELQQAYENAGSHPTEHTKCLNCGGYRGQYHRLAWFFNCNQSCMACGKKHPGQACETMVPGGKFETFFTAEYFHQVAALHGHMPWSDCGREIMQNRMKKIPAQKPKGSSKWTAEQRAERKQMFRENNLRNKYGDSYDPARGMQAQGQQPLPAAHPVQGGKDDKGKGKAPRSPLPPRTGLIGFPGFPQAPAPPPGYYSSPNVFSPWGAPIPPTWGPPAPPPWAYGGGYPYPGPPYGGAFAQPPPSSAKAPSPVRERDSPPPATAPSSQPPPEVQQLLDRLERQEQQIQNLQSQVRRTNQSSADQQVKVEDQVAETVIKKEEDLD